MSETLDLLEELSWSGPACCEEGFYCPFCFASEFRDEDGKGWSEGPIVHAVDCLITRAWFTWKGAVLNA